MLRVMTYNVRYFAHVAPVPGLRSSPSGVVRIAEALAALDPPVDVLALQEVESRSMRAHPTHRGPGTQLEAFHGALDFALRARRSPHRYAAHYFPAHTYRAGPVRIYTTGLALLVREGLEARLIEARDVTHRRFRATARVKQTRVCAGVRVASERGPLHIFNTHLSLPAFLSRRMLGRAEKMGFGVNQLEEARAVAERVRAEAEPRRVVLVGDFNAVPHSPAATHLRESLGLRDAVGSALDLEARQLAREAPTCSALGIAKRLDHILVGEDIEVEDVEGSLPLHAPGPFRGLSDHAPVLARLR